MKHPLRPLRRRRSGQVLPPGFQIAPMIDVVFVIMLFFLVMAGLVKQENLIGVPLPVRSDSPVQFGDEILVRVEDDGQVFLNDDPKDGPSEKRLPELTASLRDLQAVTRAAGSELVLTIGTAADTPYARLIEVLDSASRAGIGRISLLGAGMEE